MIAFQFERPACQRKHGETCLSFFFINLNFTESLYLILFINSGQSVITGVAMSERDWLIPGVALTFLMGSMALLVMPSVSGLLPALSILPAWIAAAALIAGLYGFAWMMLHGIAQPLLGTVRFAREHKGRLLIVASAILLAGLNMIAFMWVKPLLNYLVPFWADPLLASWDRILFLGHEPWQVLDWFSFPAMGMVYHPVWFLVMIDSLLMAAFAPASPGKSAVLLNYFVLWSVIGPLIHCLLPAAGPIFYERMGYGSRFGGLDGGAEATAVANYLWSIYASESFGAGSGISAMPSMHVTISSWVVLAFYMFARPWLPLALVFWLLIFLLSISLGWHYAVDGLVGAVAAAACHLALMGIFRMRMEGNSAAAKGASVRANPCLSVQAGSGELPRLGS
ncbi:MAG: phosphatase PAP2 family protein [Erythrobacter sp.]|uniref:phosphatase PAP2 family protein n=1 Tax=Erythrobacter sp. TaxID=1042 RepID=UPI001B2273D4|nr:phosphatase PAP2 family protein [Erythrobacter sp.]MBO6767835.1 phosphatase PAP2 family protein [Erythrobacter sp.]